jgi:hypothetical protein
MSSQPSRYIDKCQEEGQQQKQATCIQDIVNAAKQQSSATGRRMGIKAKRNTYTWIKCASNQRHSQQEIQQHRSISAARGIYADKNNTTYTKTNNNYHNIKNLGTPDSQESIS